MSHIPEATEEVLSTLNKDGTRKKIRPRLSTGSFLRRRRAVGYGLMLLFILLPYAHLLLGKTILLLDITRRTFVVFGATFLATDTVVLLLFLVAFVISIFLLTALFGRVWCGWACPQTVYMELLYRPIERLFEGPPAQQRKRDREGGGIRRFAKNVVFLVVSAVLAHTFLAYFVPAEELATWIFKNPSAHPYAFGTAMVTTVAMFIDFAWFREQTCIVACPYGRLQAVLIDKQSLIVGYDESRGEPRGRRKKDQEGESGDCIDCKACVNTCPTGIDIRRGLQMECVGCTQCIDACDAIMERIEKPRGLIRYTSQDALAGNQTKLLRPRVVIYPLILVGLLSLLGMALSSRASADVMLLRGRGVPFTVMDDGNVSNQVRIKIQNRDTKKHAYKLELIEPKSGLKVITPTNPLPVRAGHHAEGIMFVITPDKTFPENGKLPIKIRISAKGFEEVVSWQLLGPGSRFGVGGGLGLSGGKP